MYRDNKQKTRDEEEIRRDAGVAPCRPIPRPDLTQYSIVAVNDEEAAVCAQPLSISLLPFNFFPF